MNQSYKFEVLESLRAYMAWWVVIGHGLQLSGFWTITEVKDFFNGNDISTRIIVKIIDLFLHGGSAVNVFIILSGFVITHLLIVKKEPYFHFIVRRFFRLAPALYFSLILSIAFLSFYEIAYTGLEFSGDTSMRLARIAEQENNFFLHLFNHLLLIHSFFPQELIPYASTTFLAPAWSIGLEWQFYLIAPFLLFYLNRSQNFIFLIAAIFLIIRVYIHHYSGLNWQYNSFFFKVPDYFLVGILSRLVIDRLSQNKEFIDIAILIIGLLMLQDRYSSFIWLFVIGVIFYEMKAFTISSNFLKAILKVLFFNKIITSMGKWSYSTYLVHIPIFSLFVGGYAYWLGPQNVSRVDALIVLLCSLPFILLLSAIMFTYIEQPAMKYISSKLKDLKK